MKMKQKNNQYGSDSVTKEEIIERIEKLKEETTKPGSKEFEEKLAKLIEEILKIDWDEEV